MVPAVARKVAVVAAAATVTEAGVVRTVLLSVSVTTVPPVGAALDSITVQVLLPDELRLVGEQAREVSVTEATRLIAAVLETPPRVAVTVVL